MSRLRVTMSKACRNPACEKRGDHKRFSLRLCRGCGWVLQLAEIRTKRV